MKRLVEEEHVDPSYAGLCCASEFGHLDIVKYFVEEKKCNVECRDPLGQTPLQYATRGGRLTVVKYLIEE